MEWQTISMLIAIAGCAVGLSGWMTNHDKGKASDAEWRGEISAKLDNIMCSVSGIKHDVERLEMRINEHSERLAKVEQSCKQAHHRIDRIEGRGDTHE